MEPLPEPAFSILGMDMATDQSWKVRPAHTISIVRQDDDDRERPDGGQCGFVRSSSSLPPIPA